MNLVSNTTIRDALAGWADEDEMFDGMHATWSALMDSPSVSGLDQAFAYQAQVGVIYTLAERVRILNEWTAAAGDEGRSSAEWLALEPDPAVMAELNGSVTAQNIDRLFVYLYVHAHLLNVVNDTGPLAFMDVIRLRITAPRLR